MTSPDLSDLIERVEAAKGPDRELDAMIRCALFAPDGAYVRQSTINGAWCIFQVAYGKERLWEARGLTQEQRLGEFTRSIDAALSTIPAGWEWTIESAGHVEMTASRLRGPSVEGNGETPALGIVAASLRALQEKDIEHG